MKANDIKHACSLFIYGYKWFYAHSLERWCLLFPSWFQCNIYLFLFNSWLLNWSAVQCMCVCSLQIMGRNNFCVFILMRGSITALTNSFRIFSTSHAHEHFRIWSNWSFCRQLHYYTSFKLPVYETTENCWGYFQYAFCMDF